MSFYRIPALWTVYGEILVEADNLKQALEKASDAPLKHFSQEYLDDSFLIDTENMLFQSPGVDEEFRQLMNSNDKDLFDWA